MVVLKLPEDLWGPVNAHLRSEIYITKKKKKKKKKKKYIKGQSQNNL